MEIIAQTTPETASALRSGRHTPETDSMEELLTRFGARVEPLFRRADEDDSATFFSVRISNPEDARRVVARLRDLPCVTAAYIKPAVSPAIAPW